MGTVYQLPPTSVVVLWGLRTINMPYFLASFVNILRRNLNFQISKQANRIAALAFYCAFCLQKFNKV